MKPGDIVKEALKTMGWSQKALAKQAGYGEEKHTSVSNRINNHTMKVDTFVRLLNAMGYELVVRSTSPNTNKNEWTVSE